MKAELVHKNDRVRLAGEWLRITSYAIVKDHHNHYSLMKIWFSDDTVFLIPRDSELQVAR